MSASMIEALAIIISVFSLGWNVYRDVIAKPRLRVNFSISALHHPSFPEPIYKMAIQATNFGPGKIHLRSIHTKKSSWSKWIRRKEEFAYVMHDFTDDLGTRLPTVLDIGETARLFLPYEREGLLESSFTHIGLLDSFGKMHWSSAKDFKKAKEQHVSDFGADDT